MKLEIEFHPIDLPVELMEICGVSAACVYAVLLAASENNVCQMSRNEIAKKTGLKLTTIKVSFNKLEKLGIIERRYNKGYATTYYVKDILHPHPAERKEQPTEQKKEVKRVELSEQPPKVEKSHGYKFPYYIMLDAIGSSLVEYLPLSESDVDELTDERETEECTIPADWAFSDNQKMIEDALKFLSYYSDIEKSEYKKFVSEVCTCLAEAICNGMKGNTHRVEPVLIIRRINEIIHDDNYSLGQWLHDFGAKYDDYLRGHAETIYNKHNFLKTCAVNYLTEHRAGFMPEFMEVD